VARNSTAYGPGANLNIILHEHLHSLHRIWRHPRVGREDILAFQRRKLRAVLDHAYANVSFQRDIFEREGIDPREIQEPADLPKFPVCNRSLMQAAPQHEFLWRGAVAEKLWLNRTSGMQGIPSRIYRTRFEEHLLSLFRHRARGQQGIRVRDRCATVVVDLADRGRPPPRRRVGDALGLFRNFPVSCRRPWREVLHELANSRLDAFGAYPGILCRLAEAADEYGRGDLRPRLLTCGGETLLPSMRGTIEQSFDAPLFETYGAHECNLIAWQCPHTDLYHVCDDNVIVEVVAPDGRPVKDGEQGEVVLTTLHSYAMPFLRYSLGDLAVRGPETCPCGQPFSTLRAIRGRMNDYFSLPDGRSIHAYELSQLFFGVHDKWVRRRQFVQRSENEIVIRVAPSRRPGSQDLEVLHRDLCRFLGPRVDVRIDLVDELDFEPGGKFRLARSELKSNYESESAGEMPAGG